MTKNFFRIKFFTILFFLIFANIFYGTASLFAATEKSWVIAADKFDINTNGESVDSIKASIQEMIPEQIVEKLSSTASRTISENEELDRTLYTLKNERISLFLQLSSAVRAKDAIFLNDYSEKKLQSLLKDEDKKIKAIKEKIDDNLEAQKKAEERASKQSNAGNETEKKSELQKYVQMFKMLVSPDDLSLKNEPVKVYETGDKNIYTPSEKARDAGYKSRVFEKEMVSANINSLITGRISLIEEYMSVTVEMFVYPGCKSAGTVTEIGSLNDVDFISNSIAHQIMPWISASMPVTIKLNVMPKEALSNLRFSIDDIVYKDLQDEYVIDAGVHSLRFDSTGFKTAITSFGFEGNQIYNIDVELNEEKVGSLFFEMKKPLVGSIYASGEFAGEIDADNRIAEIKINESLILGQFIGSESGSGFYYVPERLITEGDFLYADVKTFDRSEYIDKRRRIMYTSYSAFVISLLGYIFTNANYKNYYSSYLDNPENNEIIKNANTWGIASNVCLGLTIGSGALFGYELFRYFKAADSVLPAKAKKKSK